MSIQIAAVRAKIEITGDVADDPLYRRKVGLGPGGGRLAAILQSGPSPPEALMRAVGLDAVDLYRRLRHFGRYGLFAGARARAVGSALNAPVIEASEKPTFVYQSGLSHACQACGSCCSATDVGPIPPSVQERIESFDWSEHLEHDGPLFRSGEHEGRRVSLMAMKNDQCVFLAEDRRCLVHRHMGVDAKPSPCRQFPWVFVRQGSQIAVSLQMECRAYWKAKSAAAPAETMEADLKELIEVGAPVHELPSTLVVDANMAISQSRYLHLESRVIEAVRTAEKTGRPEAVLAAFGESVDRELTELFAPIDREEGYLSLNRWRRAFPQDFAEPPDNWENFLTRLARFLSEMVAFSSESVDVAMSRGMTGLALRFGELSRSCTALKDLDMAAYRASDEVAVTGVLADVVVSGLFGKEAVRRGSTLREGLALLGLRVALTWAGACERARAACRVQVHEQDVIDSMVVIGKMLRERAVLDFCSRSKSLLIFLFLTNLGVFATSGAPRAEAPGGIG